MTRWSASVIKVGVVDVDVRVSNHLKEWAVGKWLLLISPMMLFKTTKELKGTSNFKFKTILHMFLCGP